MSRTRFGRGQRSLALLPLVLLSAAWTASLAGVGPTSGAALSGSQNDQMALPDGTTVPAQPIKTPASLTIPGVVAPAIAEGTRSRAVATATTNSIPAAALAAYQRAETIINAADPTCRVPWQLIAAIGRVESDHGRYGGNTLDADGVARPGIYGLALDGTHGTARIADTDAGQYDRDTDHDRAVGPMQFIPSTWSVVGVDADGDGLRNPQDIDDAALASAVYLCSGDDALDSHVGRRAAVYRYNHSRSYVDLVLAIMAAYERGDYMAVPNGTVSATYFADDSGPSTPTGHHQPGHPHGNHSEGQTPGTTSGGDGPTATPTSHPSDDPTTAPTNQPSSPVDIPTGPLDPITSPVGTILTHAQAVVQCTLDGYSLLLDPAAWNQCIYDYTH